MSRDRSIKQFAGVLVPLVCPLLSMADVRLPAVISDNMVLQRDKGMPIWGWARPAEKVTVTFAHQKTSAVADARGVWRARLDPMPAGGPFNLTISGRRTVTVTNVLVGEVWIGSGQSNMGCGVGGAHDAERAVAEANFPNIRLFNVPCVAAREPGKDIEAHWGECSPKTVAGFSAVLYFFGKRLHEELNVPVGLIHASWGGCNALSWVPREAAASIPQLKPILDASDEAAEDMESATSAFRKTFAEWEQRNVPKDPGNEGVARGWAALDCNTGDWGQLSLPRDWDWDELTVKGARWFRKEVDVPPGWAGNALTLGLGASTDLLTVYFNNVTVGSLDSLTPYSWVNMRTYPVPGNLVKAGRNVIAVRAFRYLGGGLTGPGVELSLRGPANEKPIPLGGPWKTKVESEFPVGDDYFLAPPLPPEPTACGAVGCPGAMFNGMIAPLIPFGIRGVCWYQGESNVRSADEYRQLLPALIKSWRKAWAQRDLPFLIVQLANFTSGPAWAELQEAQMLTARTVPHCGLIVANDIGDPYDIHPRRKQEVGHRLSLSALATVYGRKDNESSGPVYESMAVKGNRIRLKFSHVGGGLVAKGGGELIGFEIAGADRKFVPAKAAIEGRSVIVWSEAVPHPVAVRYAWTGNPTCNLRNRAGLPASCFRTDRWPADVRTRRPKYG